MGYLRLQHLWKLYGSVVAVRDLCLECRDGEFLALLGPSGCGKTSTLRMVAGLERVSEGEIWLGDRRIDGLPSSERRVAMAFEGFALYPHLTVFDNIAFPLRVQGLALEQIRRRVQEVAEATGISAVLGQRAARLGAGQQQMASLARALVRDAELYLMDEPISHLDARERLRMRAELKRIHHTRKLTIVFVTHDQSEALAMADRIAVMNQGVLQQVGTPDEVFNHPANEFVASFVGEPPMNLVECKARLTDRLLELRTDGIRMEVPLNQLAGRLKGLKGETVKVGLRPSDLVLVAPDDPSAQIRGVVDFVENLGDEVVYSVRVGRHVLLVEAAAGAGAKRGEPVGVMALRARVHLFDARDGASLLEPQADGR